MLTAAASLLTVTFVVLGGLAALFFITSWLAWRDRPEEPPTNGLPFHEITAEGSSMTVLDDDTEDMP